MLLYLEGLDAPTIAEITGLSSGNIRISNLQNKKHSQPAISRRTSEDIMILEPPNYDPITVWQSQTEHLAPSLEEILNQARQFQEGIGAAPLFAVILLLLYIPQEDFADRRQYLVGRGHSLRVADCLGLLPSAQDLSHGQLIADLFARCRHDAGSRFLSTRAAAAARLFSG